MPVALKSKIGSYFSCNIVKYYYNFNECFLFNIIKKNKFEMAFTPDFSIKQYFKNYS